MSAVISDIGCRLAGAAATAGYQLAGGCWRRLALTGGWLGSENRAGVSALQWRHMAWLSIQLAAVCPATNQ